MTAFTRISPGDVENGGISDLSIPEYNVTVATAPLHLPVVHVVTPKGPLASKKGTIWIAPGQFKQLFGDVFDHKSPFYNPTSALIQALGKGNQGTIGVRRLSANEEVSRVSLSAFVKKVEVLDYERDSAGRFKYTPEGERIVKVGKTYQGLDITIKPDDAAKTAKPGELKVRTISAALGEPETVVYPLFEALAGVGDVYNQSGLHLGVRDENMNWRSVSEFVRNTGVFPFDLRQFTDPVNGERVYGKTVSNRDSAKFTLFPAEMNKVSYSLRFGFGAYTGTNANRPNKAVPAAFNDLVTYDENIDALCQLMYVVENEHNESLVEVGESSDYYKQMNPFTCVNHTGAPYYAISTSNTIKWDMSGAVKSQGGISALLTSAGELPSYVTKPVVPDPFGLLTDVVRPITHAQAWEINNKLMLSDLTNYVSGPDMKDVTRNKQSLFWDVGYSQDVKEMAASMLGRRKDVVVIPCGTVWVPGMVNDQEEVYSRAAMITSLLRMTPESEKWGTPATRAAVNIVQIKLTDEPTGWYFSQNIDLAYAFALFAGNNSGLITAANSPDSGDNRKLRLGHSPTIGFEDTEVSSENFANGHITIKPYDWDTQSYRPGLPTVYTNPDSVLKDLVTPFLCVCMEKLSAEQWKLVVGDTTITQENYAAIMKDNIESECRRAVGGMVSNINAVTSFQEGIPGSRAKLSVALHGSFNKAKYMMEFDLFVHNQQDEAATA